MSSAHHVGPVELIPAILLSVHGDDIPERPHTHDRHAWNAWREQYRVALGLSEDDVPDGMHIVLRSIDNRRLLDAVIDCTRERAGEGRVSLPRRGRSPARQGVGGGNSCCVDLRDGTQDWVRLVGDRPPDWTIIWTGHPWVLGRVVDDTVEVTEQAEAPAPRAVARFPTEDFRVAVDHALADRESFAYRLERRLLQQGHDEPAKTARTIAGL